MPVFGWKDGEVDDLIPFTVVGSDNSRLSVAAATSAQAAPKGIVLLCHPFFKYGMGYFWRNGYHEWLTAAGYHVVAFDFKGFGHSTLSGISFADDVTAIATWARQRYPALPLHLFGASFGAYHAIHCLAKHGEKFASAVFDSVPARITDFFNRGVSGAVMRYISASRWSRITGTNSILESLPAAGGMPCLFIYGRLDRYISSGEIASIARICRSATVRMFEECGHLEIRKIHRADYANTILRFIDTQEGGRE